MEIIKGYIYSYTYLFGVIFLIGLLQKLFKLRLETSRKLIHIFIGFTWLILLKYHVYTWHFIVVPFSFVLINTISYKFKIFKMYERTDESKNHYGTIYYAISMTVMAAVSLLFPQALFPYGIAVFCLSFGDGAAALFGSMFSRYNIMITKEKSVIGTSCCCIFTFLGLILFTLILPVKISIPAMLILSVSTAILELAGKGLDNFTITWGIMILSTLMLNWGQK